MLSTHTLCDIIKYKIFPPLGFSSFSSASKPSMAFSLFYDALWLHLSTIIIIIRRDAGLKTWRLRRKCAVCCSLRRSQTSRLLLFCCVPPSPWKGGSGVEGVCRCHSGRLLRLLCVLVNLVGWLHAEDPCEILEIGEAGATAHYSTLIILIIFPFIIFYYSGRDVLARHRWLHFRNHCSGRAIARGYKWKNMFRLPSFFGLCVIVNNTYFA